MSIVCCKVTPTCIRIASDSITVRGYTQSKGKNTEHSKLITINNMIIGSTGTIEESNMFQIFCQNKQPLEASNREVLNFLFEFSEWKKKKIENSKINNSYILVFKGKAFHINEFMVDEIKTYEAIGAGMDFALASLYLKHDVQSAVEVACQLSIFCELPIIMYSMDLLNDNIITGGEYGRI